MCNFVVPVRTCSKCYQKEPCVTEKERRFSRVGRNQKRQSAYVEPAQDCYSRWCAFSSEHPGFCGSCWLSCKHTYGETREIQGGSPSYLCHTCDSCSEPHCPCQLSRSAGSLNDMLRREEPGWFARLTGSFAN